jgi:hypothetical protein
MKPRIILGLGRYLTGQNKKIQVLLELNADVTTDGRRNTLVSNADLSLDPHAGLEVSYKNLIYLRLGASNFQRVLDDKDSTNQAKYTLWQPSAGVGIHISGLVVDYAYTSLQTQSNPLFSHIISARLDINKGRKSKPARTVNHSTEPTSQSVDLPTGSSPSIR